MPESARAMGCLMPAVLVAAACAVGTMARSDAGATARPAVVPHLLGVWHGKGQLFGKPAEFRMEWSRLGDAFLRLEFSNAFAPAAPEADPIPVLEAAAIYRFGSGGALTGSWFDSRGTELPLAADVSDSAIVVQWGTEQSAEQGRTTYRWTGPGTARVTDEVLKDGEYRVFAAADYWRSSAAAVAAGGEASAP